MYGQWCGTIQQSGGLAHERAKEGILLQGDLPVLGRGTGTAVRALMGPEFSLLQDTGEGWAKRKKN